MIAACVLGGIIGFTPFTWETSGLIIALFVLIMILNANLAIMTMMVMVTKPLSLLLMPMTFELGHFLLDGPTQSLFQWAINAPVLAMLGLKYYATAGGLIMGTILGLLCAIILIAALGRIRAKLSTLEEGSDLFKKVTGFVPVRILLFVFVGGGKGKKTWAEVASKKIGNPIRPIGVVFALMVVAVLILVRFMFADEIVLAQLKDNLEWANGASVDVKSASLNLSDLDGR